MSSATRRILPELTPENRDFWTGGARGELRIQRCAACRTFVHPPAPICPGCHGRELSPEAVSGRGTLFGFTINHQDWGGPEPPYAIGLVELDEQPGLRVLANLVDAEPAALSCGMPVAVRFERADDVWLPRFAPVAP